MQVKRRCRSSSRIRQKRAKTGTEDRAPKPSVNLPSAKRKVIPKKLRRIVAVRAAEENTLPDLTQKSDVVKLKVRYDMNNESLEKRFTDIDESLLHRSSRWTANKATLLRYLAAALILGACFHYAPMFILFVDCAEDTLIWPKRCAGSPIEATAEDMSLVTALTMLTAAIFMNLFDLRTTFASIARRALACPSQTALSAVIAGTFCFTVPSLPVLGITSKLMAFTATNALLNLWHEIVLAPSGEKAFVKATLTAFTKSTFETLGAEGFGAAAAHYGGATGMLVLRVGVPIAYAKMCYKAFAYPQVVEDHN